MNLKKTESLNDKQIWINIIINFVFLVYVSVLTFYPPLIGFVMESSAIVVIRFILSIINLILVFYLFNNIKRKGYLISFVNYSILTVAYFVVFWDFFIQVFIIIFLFAGASEKP